MKHSEIRKFFKSLFLNGSDLGFVSNNFFLADLGWYFTPWIRIRGFSIFADPGNQNLADPTDPDPKLCFSPYLFPFPVFLFFPNPLTIAHWQIGNYTPLRNTLPVQNSYDTKNLMALKTSDSNISNFKIFLRNIIDLFLVSRPTLFEDSFHQLMRLPAYELRRRLYIIFKVIQTNIHFIILNTFCIITVYNVKCEKIVRTTEF